MRLIKLFQPPLMGAPDLIKVKTAITVSLKTGYDTPNKERVVPDLNWRDHLPDKIGKEEKNTWIT
jgi:hypothetical protein